MKLPDDVYRTPPRGARRTNRVVPTKGRTAAVVDASKDGKDRNGGGGLSENVTDEVLASPKREKESEKQVVKREAKVKDDVYKTPAATVGSKRTSLRKQVLTKKK